MSFKVTDAFAAIVDQDQPAQDMQSTLRSTLLLCLSLMRQTFRLGQIYNIYRQQNDNLKAEILSLMGRQRCRKSRKCWLTAFSPFPTMFLKGLYLRAVISWDCVVKS